jgi:hypothetical protein
MSYTPSVGQGYALLGKLTGANFNSTADQAIPINASKYIIRRITIQNASLSLTLAAGGFYTATAKGGTPIVSSVQVYSALTAALAFLDTTLASLTSVLTGSSIYFSLTTAQGAAATADIYVWGDWLA